MIIDSFLNKYTRRLFQNKNNHPFYQVLLWRLWRVWTRLNYKKKSRHYLPELSERGVSILGNSNVTDLARSVATLFADIPIQNGFCSLPREKNSIVAPLIYRVVQEHKAKIESHFRSNFRVNWFEVQKLVESSQTAGGSFLYHTDDVPDDVFKLFIYLTDCTEQTGAFRTFDYNVTNQLIKAGMMESSNPGQPRVDAQKLVSTDLEKSLIVIEGEKGTVFMFDNNLIHKGTLPRRGQRIHVSMELMPDVKPQNFSQFSKNCALPIKEYFPSNPFRA